MTSRDTTIDVTDDPAALQALGVAPSSTSGSSGGGSGGGSDGCTAGTGRPMHGLALLAGAAALLALRRARRRPL
jgi:hypothetical protein